jgi:uncharacterized membrane protein
MKKWYTSKTVWLGALAVAMSIVTIIDQGGSWTAAILAGFGAASIVLRSITDKKIIK